MSAPTLIKIALISDTHGYFGADVDKHLADVDEIWHGGDIGNTEAADHYESLGIQLRMVWGNIDGHELRIRYPEEIVFEVDGLKVLIMHIGGYPGRYNKRSYHLIKKNKPDIFICGHSHILKVIRDKENHLLHFNPGACGKKGFHKVRTMIKFDINAGKIENVRVIELAQRGKISHAG